MAGNVGVSEVSGSTHAVVALSGMALAFGRVDRITYHEDGRTLESDTDHTVMLGLVSCAFAARHLPWLDLGLVAQYSLVHDLPEVYAGDTPTLHLLSEDAKAAKTARETAAIERIEEEVGSEFPWVSQTLHSYEARDRPEARFVKAMDKLLPKVTHVLNGCATVREQGMDREKLMERYAAQLEELKEYASDFPPLFDLRADLLLLVLEAMGEA